MLCSNCGADNPEAARFCIECASPFARRCPSCGTENPPHAKFCAQCATHLSDRGSPASSSALSVPPRRSVEVYVATTEGKADSPLDGERKTVTALFADIKGSKDFCHGREQSYEHRLRAGVDPGPKPGPSNAARRKGCKKIFREKVSGASWERPEFQRVSISSAAAIRSSFGSWTV